MAFVFFSRNKGGEKILKVIQTLNDIEYLKSLNNVPLELVNAIEQDFHQLMAELGSDEESFSFVLPTRLAIILFEPGDDVIEIVGDKLHLEYVEEITEGSIDYYRIVKRHDHEFQLIYSLTGCHNEKVENWLEEQAE